MKFANLVLQSPILRSRHDLFPAAGRGQAALRHQPTPGEQLVWGDAMPTSHQAYRHTRLEGLFDHANLLRGRPAPTTLNRRDDLNAIGRIGHRHGCMPHTCQVGDRVRLVRGLSQSSSTVPEPDSAVNVTRFGCAIHCSHQSETIECAYQRLSCAAAWVQVSDPASSRTAAGPGTPGVPLVPFSSALRRSSKAWLASAPRYTLTTLANSAASAAVRLPAATAAAMLAIASTLSTAFSSGGSSTATGWCLIGGTSRSMHTRMAAISPSSASAITLRAIHSARSDNRFWASAVARLTIPRGRPAGFPL